MSLLWTIDPPPGCFYDPDDHSYWWGLKRLLGVTDTLKAAALVDDTWFREEYRQRGSDVHMATTWLEDGEVDWENLEANGIAGYVRCWERFLARTGFDIWYREQPIFDINAGVAGTLDRAGFMPQRRSGSIPAWNAPMILDIKTGVPRPENELQLAGYDYILSPEYLPTPRRLGCVYLDRDGGEANLITYRDPQARNAFRGAVSVVNWKSNH